MMDDAYPKVQAVSAPDVDAEVIFDFNEFGTWFRQGPVHDGWTLGSPDRLSEAGDARTAWGPRRPSFMLQMAGSRAVAARAQSALARWLLQPEGWVLFQLDAMTPPVWLHMIGAEPQDLQFDLVRKGAGRDIWTVGITFDADPFLYGERVTLFDGTVPNDPTVEGGMVAPLGDVPGDAPMPLRVKIGYADEMAGQIQASDFRHSLFIASGADTTALGAGAGDGATDVHPDVSTGSLDVFMGGTARIISFATDAGLIDRFTLTLPDDIQRGSYRLLAHVGRDSGDYEFSLSVRVAHAGLAHTTPVAKLFVPSGGAYLWMDLGEFSYPIHGVPTGADASEIGPTTFTVMAGAAAGGTLRVSALLLVPTHPLGGIPTRSLTLSRGRATTERVSATTLDSGQESTWSLTRYTGRVVPAGKPVLGGWPYAMPGAESKIVMVRNVSASPALPLSQEVDRGDRVSSLTVSGHPQWLYLPSEEV